MLEYGESRGIKVNRSHAACYALLACITAYMRCYWPEEFYAAMLNAFIENSDKVRAYLSQASQAKIPLLPPDINRSEIIFTAEDGKIRFGLGGIKGIKSMGESITSVRNQGGPFKGLNDLFTRMGDSGNLLNKTAIEGLVYSGALSQFSKNKNQLLAAFPILEKGYKTSAVDRALNQVSLFGDIQTEIELPNVADMPMKKQLEKENEVLSVYLSGHPSQVLDSMFTKNSSLVRLEDLAAGEVRRNVITGGMICNSRTFYTRNGDLMATFQLESQFASVACVVFPKSMNECGDLIKDQTIVTVAGSYVQDRDGEGYQFFVNSIREMSSFADEAAPFKVYIHSKAEQEIVLQYIATHPGTRKVMLCGSNGKNFVLSKGVEMNLSALDFLSGGFQGYLQA